MRFAGAGRTSQKTAGQVPREMDQPAHTVTGKSTAAWIDIDGGGSRQVTAEEAAILQSYPPEWVYGRPAPTVVGTRRSSTGMLIGRQLDDNSRQDSGGHNGEVGKAPHQLAGVRVTKEQAAALQSYPDHLKEEVLTDLIALDLFAGTGWGVACKWLGIEEWGVDNMPEVVETRSANDMRTIFHDVWDGLLRPSVFMPTGRKYRVLIASPPCQTFSQAGGGSGRKALDQVLAAVHEGRYKRPEDLYELGTETDPRTALVLTPLAYAYRDRPEYIVFEQVPPVLPVWEACAVELRELGYSVVTGILNAEQYGTVDRCAMHSQTAIAPSVANSSLLATAPGYAVVRAMTPSDLSLTRLARTVVAHWASAIGRDGASVATWLLRERQEAMKVASEKTMPTGAEVAMWTTVATSEFGLTTAIAVSIAWSWRTALDALSLTPKWSIMSMEAQITTIRAILSSIAATLTIGSDIVQGTLAVGCGLCLDNAVPQTRKRAILIARRDGIEAAMPVPTHSKYYNRDPKRLDDGVLPWVSMAEALGWGTTAKPSYTVTGGGRETGGYEAFPTGARAGMSKAIEEGEFAPRGAGLSSGLRPNEPIRPVDEPAVTQAFGHNASSKRWVREPKDGETTYDVVKESTEYLTPEEAAALQSYPTNWVLRSNYGTNGDPEKRGERTQDQPAATITSKADRNMWESREAVRDEEGQWKWKDTPSTTIAGDPRITAREHHYHGEQNSTSFRLELPEAETLQSYPPMVWKGTKGKQFLQIGNAVPPLLARAILSVLLTDDTIVE